MTLPGAYGSANMAIQVMRAHVLPSHHHHSKIISKGGLLNGALMCVYVMVLQPMAHGLHGALQGLLCSLQPHF
jgi:hypothetical protein